MEQILSKLKSNDKYPPFGLIAGAANIIKIYKIDITNILVPASVANCLSGFNPLLANQQKNKNTASVASCTYNVGSES